MASSEELGAGSFVGFCEDKRMRRCEGSWMGWEGGPDLIEVTGFEAKVSNLSCFTYFL